MYHCSMCTNNFVTPEEVIKHYEQVHHRKYGNRFKCVLEDCNRFFTDFYALKRHWISKHRNEDDIQDTEHVEMECEEEDENHFKRKEAFYNLKPSLQQNIESATAEYVADLQVEIITRNQIDFILSKTEELFKKSVLSNLKKLILETSEKDEHHTSIINDIFDVFDNIFEDFKTEHQRIEYFKENETYASPQSFIIGNLDVNSIQNHTGVISQQNITGEHISIRKTCEQLFSIPEFLSTMVDYIAKSIKFKSTGLACNFLQGKLYEQHIKSFPQKVYIPLNISYDEVEVNNPIGAHPGIHKIGAIYFSFLSMPPQFASKLENIFLTLLFCHNDRVYFGMSKCIAPLVKELRDLESKPVVVTDEGIEVFVICQIVSGDHLAMSEILGFKESATANFPCRICKIPLEELQFSCRENIALRRTVKNYDEDIEINKGSETGLNSKCDFNVLKFYHCITNSYSDELHDVKEGILRRINSLLILHFIDEKKYFKLSDLTSCQGSFYFGMVENNNRPPFLKREKLENMTLGMSGSEAYTFTQHLGLIIGHKIDEDDSHWELYKLLCKFIRMMNKRTISDKTTREIENLVGTMNAKFLELFPGEHFTLKQHMIQHYGYLMRNLGPIKPLSCIRTESAHQRSKRYAHITNSRVNLPKTLAISNQLRMVSRLLMKKPLIDKFEVGPSIAIESDDLRRYNVQHQELDTMFAVKHLRKCGLDYNDNMILTIENLRTPVFGKIVHIFVNSKENINCVKFLVNILDTEHFNDHVQAYSVNLESNVHKIINYNDLENKFPTDVLYTALGEPHIIVHE